MLMTLGEKNRMSKKQLTLKIHKEVSYRRDWNAKGCIVFSEQKAATTWTWPKQCIFFLFFFLYPLPLKTSSSSLLSSKQFIKFSCGLIIDFRVIIWVVIKEPLNRFYQVVQWASLFIIIIAITVIISAVVVIIIAIASSEFREKEKVKERGEWEFRPSLFSHTRRKRKFEPTRPFGHGISNPTPYQVAPCSYSRSRRPPLGVRISHLDNNIVANPLSEPTRGGLLLVIKALQPGCNDAAFFI